MSPGRGFQAFVKFGTLAAFGASEEVEILKFRPDRRVGPLIARRSNEADEKIMRAGLVYQIDQPRNHVLDERHVAAAFAGGAVAVAEIVLHLDDDEHAMLEIDAFI
jgi:hypothetical protein